MTGSRPKIAVGFSGGVDSLVTCLLLKNKGYDVFAVTLIFTNNQMEKSFQDHVKKAAEKICINHEFLDIRKAFTQVLSYFKMGYLSGETPNPCVYCNQHIKWPYLFKYAGNIGATKVATGHYAQIGRVDGDYFISKGVDKEKEQSFFLWNLLPEQLENVELPLGNMQKAEVKAIAKKYGFTSYAKQKESTGPCFTGKNYRETLKTMLKDSENPGKGNFLSEDGEVLGRHDGYFYYTVSQRKGLGLKMPGKQFVKTILPDKNQVILAHARRLWSWQFYLRNFIIHKPEALENCSVEIKIRYRSQKARGVLINKGERILVHLSEPEWAVAPGQTAAIYTDGILIGGGYIDDIALK